MVSTYTTRLRVDKQGDGDNQGTWGAVANLQFEVLEQAISGYESVAFVEPGPDSLTTANGDTAGDEARNMMVEITGSLSQARIMECPQVEKLYIVYNNTTGGFALTFRPTGGSGISIPNGEKRLLYCDGTNIVDAISNITLTGTETLTNKTLTSPTITGPTITGTVAGGAIYTAPVLDLPQINDLSDDHQYVFVVSELAADRNVTLPLLGADDEFVFKDHTVTLTNKTLTSPNINTAVIEGGTIGATTPVTAFDCDNIKIDGNTISSTDTDGSINLTPDGAGGVVVTGYTQGVVQTLASGTTVTPDLATADNFTLTLDHNATLANPSNPVAGQSGAIAIVQGSTGGTMSFGANWHFPNGGAAPTLSTGTGDVDILHYYVRTTSSIICSLGKNYV